MRHHGFPLLLSLALSLGLGAGAQARHPGEYLHRVSTALQTPHFDWATPYAQGKPRVLFITPRTIAPREIVELWQRFDLDLQAFTMAHSGLMSFESEAGAAPYDLAVEGTSIEEKTEELLGKLAGKYDAFVLANASLDALPREAQYKLLKQVSEGAGLLFTFGRRSKLALFKRPLAEGRETVTAGVPLGALEYFRQPKVLQALKAASAADLPARVLETFRFGQGRIAVLSYGEAPGTYYGGPGLAPAERWSPHWAADYEYSLSLVYKALLWTTATRRPTVNLAALPADTVSYQRAQLPARLPLQLTCEGPAGLTGTLLVLVRDRSNTLESRQELPLTLQAGANALTVEVPRVKAGEHFLDLLVRSTRGTEQWGSVCFNVTSPVALARFAPQRESAPPGQTAVLEATLSAGAPADAHLLVALTDTNGRCYGRRDVKLEPGQTAIKPLALDLSGATTIATRLHGELQVGGSTVAEAESFVFVPRRQSNLFRSVIWGVGGDSGLTYLALRQLRAAGFTDHLSHPSPEGTTERLMALNDLPLVCYAYRIMGHADEQGWRKDDWVKEVADGCFYNPELQQQARDSVLGRIKNVISYGPSLYSLGDENYYDEKGGFSPTGRAAFGQMLQHKYATIGALNGAWGTDYASFEAIPALPPEEAIRQGQWPLAHEHLSFCEQEYADYHHYLREQIRQADPGAWVGAEGSVPGNLEETIRSLEVWGPYADKRGNELLRSLSTPALVRGNWWGGYVGSHGGRQGAGVLWRQLLGGNVNTSLYFAATGAEGLFAGDLGYAEYFRKLLPELREIYGGIGQMLAASRVPDDGLAVRWSQADEHAARMFAAVGSPIASQGNLLGLLDSLGRGYRFVTTGMIEQGALRSGVRVLFLPCAQAISDAEAKAITAFVEAGGTVIADVGPGSLTGVCRPLFRSAAGDLPQWRGQLDGLFGLTRNGAPQSKSITADLTFHFRGSSDHALFKFPYRLDTSVVGTGELSLEGLPVYLKRAHGKGEAILLNFTFPSPEHPGGPLLLAGLLGDAGVTGGACLGTSRGYTCRRFTSGALTLVGVCREAATARDTTLLLGEPRYVYDVRAAKLIGKLRHLELPATGPANRVFALLPARAAPPVVKAPPAAARGEKTVVQVSFEKAGAAPEGRWLRRQVLRPDGTEAAAYRDYLVLEKSTAQTTVPWAYNDPPGAWTVRVTDVATGLAAAVKVTLK